MSTSIRIRTTEVENTSDLAELLADPNVKAVKEFDDDIIALEFKKAEVVQDKEFSNPWQTITIVIAEVSEGFAVVKSVISDGDNDEVQICNNYDEAKKVAEKWKWDDP